MVGPLFPLLVPLLFGPVLYLISTLRKEHGSSRGADESWEWIERPYVPCNSLHLTLLSHWMEVSHQMEVSRKDSLEGACHESIWKALFEFCYVCFEAVAFWDGSLVQLHMGR